MRNLKVELENLGVLRRATFTTNDFTIICGENNTGKTYAAYALYGFLKFWRRHLPRHNFNKEVDTLLNDGVVSINISKYRSEANKILKQGCDEYAKNLSEIFASKSNKFAESVYQIQFSKDQYSTDRLFQRHFLTSNEENIFSAVKEEGSDEIVFSLLIEKNVTDRLPKDVIKEFISNCIHDLLFNPLLPNPFIASVERTGASIFRKELDFARNRLLEEMMVKSEDVDPMDILFKSYKDYPLPVKINVDFTRNLQSVSKEQSFVFHCHSDILSDFKEILGGEYSIDKEDTIYFKPQGKSQKLQLDESSSSVRSLLDVGFYLRHIAKRGDILFIDEPELNLHPSNQRRMARLLVRLMNVGIKIFITTHSDYLLKELNTLIMLRSDEPSIKKIAKREQYQPDELLDPQKISVYIAKNDLVRLQGNKRSSTWPTLVAADVDEQLGIEVPSFDNVIEKMNRIQEEIYWGECK